MYLEALLCTVLVNEQIQIKQLEIVTEKPESRQQFEALNTDRTGKLLYYLTACNTVQNEVSRTSEFPCNKNMNRLLVCLNA